MPSCWVEVNLGALRHNFQAIQELVGPQTTMIAVIKANAYGHGAIEVARTLAAEGTQYFAVTRVEEALPLREAGVQTPILLLAPAPPDEVDTLVAHQLTACLSSYEDAERLSKAAVQQQTTARAQLKINTGMGRLGVEPEEAVEVAKCIVQLPNLELESAFTHFARAAGSGRDSGEVHLQFSKFQPLIHHISRATAIPPSRFHCANSATLLRFPAMRLSCVRPGTILYGQYPSALASESAMQQHLQLREIFSVKARIIALKNLQPGQTVGYGGEWRALRPSRIATVAVGYADGLSQEPQTRQDSPRVAIPRAVRQAAKQAAQWTGLKGGDAPRTVLLHNERAPIIGRIAMQQCSIDVTHVKDVAVGDVVTVFMRRTSTGAHLPRVYIQDG